MPATSRRFIIDATAGMRALIEARVAREEQSRSAILRDCLTQYFRENKAQIDALLAALENQPTSAEAIRPYFQLPADVEVQFDRLYASMGISSENALVQAIMFIEATRPGVNHDQAIAALPTTTNKRRKTDAETP
jgi:hypothetical protein